METRHIGNIEVTFVGLGTNSFGACIDQAGAKEVVDAALDAGINFFDTADVYGSGASEVLLGKALGSRRYDVVIAAKFGMPARSRETRRHTRVRAHRVRRQPAATRHRPHRSLLPAHRRPDGADRGDPRRARRAGQGRQVHKIACSNFPSALIDDTTKTAASAETVQFMAMENELSQLRRESTSAHASTLDAPAARGAELIATVERNDMAAVSLTNSRGR
jgi:aryl-alcohol dehydrogenase-like predicted oxidoreductase